MKPHAPIPAPPHPTYSIKKVIQDALAEDAGDRGDVTTLATVHESTQAVGTFLAKDNGIVAGLAVADMVFEAVDPQLQVTWTAKDGDSVVVGQKFGTVRGSAASILVAERIALNFMQRMSGIATSTHHMVQAVQPHPAKVLESRKTVPGLRLLDKWAVLIGGGHNHRIGLYDMMMIKDNHIEAAGGIKAAVQRAQDYIQSHNLQGLGVEVETRTLAEVDEVLEVIRSGTSPVTRVMLDNMSRKDPGAEGGLDVSMLQAAVRRIDGAIETEASGNVTLDTIGTIAATGVTYISVGALTHSVKALDISLKIQVLT
mmetsp:Transcript_37579/g.83688  ORF Transcript_37579/g.83688 Transcript_37579/m.83688 type:complete len:313 (-) Transcript_37579:990-1928(-)|eukprot:CAMPEP_0202904110 /NCGR_PEP_ID=MMETSP1392-20130828/27939_1 /ASSEMBLY_ACC=CAM_ASM_000868 /TAXON_ID=225041 /ORGANISM="Chlamydomonas chlamydogama, Strain SAG 11-48b" /LENGTH=312 /DNA_ID=CAMNT_0049591597 /DNA_START=43 /DNA_END=981 /DNA_ORIENTATION=+